MVGKSTCGKAQIGKRGNATTPNNTIAATTSEVAIGRWMKGAETLIGKPRDGG